MLGPDPDPVFKFSGSELESGFQMSLDPDSVSASGSLSKKECRKGSKSYSLEENLKIMTKDRQKIN